MTVESEFPCKGFFGMISTADERDPGTYAIIGAAMRVHTELGCGFLERVYHEALAIELAQNDIPFRREADLVVQYRGTPLLCPYRADFICYNSIILEIKALQTLNSEHRAQLINYLKAASLNRGLLLNFGTKRLEHERIVNKY